MIIHCVVCQTNMVVIETETHEKLETATTLYRCIHCDSCIRIIDDIEENKQELRRLSLLLVQSGTETDEEN